MENIKLVLGTMTFGESLFEEDSYKIVKKFSELGFEELDTAYTYNGGKSEELIGKTLGKLGNDKVKVATKVNPKVTGKLDKESIINQCNTSLERMGVESLDILYLHFPDPSTPFEESLEACNELYKAGKIKELGISNHPAWLVAAAYNICKNNGWILPTVYEGLYNPLSRLAEGELKECLEHYNIRFYAYNPLAGGLLTYKYSSEHREVESGRFKNRPNYKDRYLIDSFFEASDLIKEKCKEYDISIIEATYRWLAYHSMLKPEKGDGIIVGVSRPEQLEQNVSVLSKGKLPEALVEVFENAWLISKPDAPPYYRSVNQM